MTFTDPEWLRLGWLAVPIVALYLYRRRRRPVEIPSLLLWEWAHERETRRPLWGRLRDPLSLLAQLAILALATAAAAGPESDEPGPRRERWAVVLDGSPSMGAAESAAPETSESPRRTRFAAARVAAAETLERASSLDRVAVVVAGATPRLVASPGMDAAARARALAAARPDRRTGGRATASDEASDEETGDRTRWERARTVAEEALGGAPDRWILVTDGRPRLGATEGARHVRTVGEPTSSVALVGVTAEVDPATLETVARLTIENGGPEATERRLIAAGPGAPRAPLALSLGPGERVVRTIRLRPDAEGIVEIRLDPPDAQPADDAVGIPVEPMPRVRLVVDHPDGLPPFLVEAVRALGDLVDTAGSSIVTGSTPGPVLPPRTVLVRRGAGRPESLRRGAVLLLDAPGGTERSPATVTRVAANHPALRDVPLGHLGLRRARVWEPGEDETTLLAAEGGAVMTAFERDGVRAIRVGFALADSNFPVLPAFPLWLRGALRWLAGDARTLVSPVLRAGEPLEPRRPLDPSVERVFAGGPAVGEELVGIPVRDGTFRFDPPRGARTSSRDLFVRIGDRRQAVRIHDLPHHAPRLGSSPDRSERPVPDRAGVREPDRDLRPVVVAALVAALLAEWWWFHRR